MWSVQYTRNTFELWVHFLHTKVELDSQYGEGFPSRDHQPYPCQCQHNNIIVHNQDHTPLPHLTKPAFLNIVNKLERIIVWFKTKKDNKIPDYDWNIAGLHTFFISVDSRSNNANVSILNISQPCDQIVTKLSISLWASETRCGFTQS